MNHRFDWHGLPQSLRLTPLYHVVPTGLVPIAKPFHERSANIDELSGVGVVPLRPNRKVFPVCRMHGRRQQGIIKIISESSVWKFGQKIR